MPNQKTTTAQENNEPSTQTPSPSEPPISKEKKKKMTILIIVIVGLFLVLVVGGSVLAYYSVRRAVREAVPSRESILEKVEQAAQQIEESLEEVSTRQVGKFATYQEVPVNVSPQIPDYTINTDLSNIENPGEIRISGEMQQKLAQNGFVVVPDFYREFFSVYEENRYSSIPNFVTTDSMLHNYHLMFNHLLKSLEEDKLAPALEQLNKSMLADSLNQYEQLKGTPWENAAKRNVGFFAVGSKLMDSNVQVPSFVRSEVSQELDFIEASGGLEESPVMNIGFSDGTIIESPQGPLALEKLKEDYSQYIPRGHYTKTEQLKRYFKSMMWYGRLTFRVKNEDEIRSAILITMLLNDEKNYASWDTIFEPINFFVGKSDDITYYHVRDIADQAYGPFMTTQMAINNTIAFGEVVDDMKKLDPPQINSIPVFQAELQPDREEEIKGFRFMGQRFTIDASVFQRLMCREVGNKSGTMDCPTADSRMLPKGLDIPAALGSKEAESLLHDMGEFDYENYPENMEKLQQHVSGLEQDVWTQNLYWAWLYTLLPTLEEKPQGYPMFMRNTGWIRKGLNTFLASWMELKHDTILYAKQAYAELGGGPIPEDKDDRGYVEPDPYVYARLVSLIRYTSDGLESRGILDPEQKENLKRMEDLAMSLKDISEKELNGEPLSSSDYELIRSYGGQIEHFWLEVNKEEMEAKGATAQSQLDDSPAAIVADVATDPNGFVLEEGVGWIHNIFVVVPIDGELRLTRGAVFSHYEFPWPMGDRLTDEAWRELLDSDDAPGLADWTSEFRADFPFDE